MACTDDQEFITKLLNQEHNLDIMRADIAGELLKRNLIIPKELVESIGNNEEASYQLKLMPDQIMTSVKI
jgi:hypothetical protein